jgi:hypothetical protein
MIAHVIGSFCADIRDMAALTPAVPVLIVRLQEADKIGHAGPIPVFGHNRNLSIGRRLAPLPNPE